MPEVCAGRDFVYQVRGRECFIVRLHPLIEPPGIAEKIETVAMLLKFAKAARAEGIIRQRVGDIFVAPINQREEKAQKSDPVHRIGGGELANLVCVCECFTDVYAFEAAISVEDRYPSLIQQIVTHYALPLFISFIPMHDLAGRRWSGTPPFLRSN